MLRRTRFKEPVLKHLLEAGADAAHVVSGCTVHSARQDYAHLQEKNATALHVLADAHDGTENGWCSSSSADEIVRLLLLHKAEVD